MTRFLNPLLILAGIAAMVYGIWFRPPAVNPDPNHTHADFAVWINGVQLDFSDPTYMSTPPAESALLDLIPAVQAHGDEEDGHVVPGREYLHLHDGNGHVIHRHKPGLTFGDFFTSIGFTMTATCFAEGGATPVCNAGDKKWQMFVNDAEVSVSPAYNFQDLDRILLTYGATPEQITMQLGKLSDDACRYSQTCPERGKPPEENCISDPKVPCVIQ